MKIQIIAMLLTLLNLSLNARLLNISIEKRANEEIKKYSSFNLILEKEYYTSLPTSEIEKNIYKLTEHFVKSIMLNKIDYSSLNLNYKEANKYLIQSELIDNKFLKYKIFKIKNINGTFKSYSLIYTKKGFYKLELYIENNTESLEIFNLNITYFSKNSDKISNEMIFSPKE
ncbi:hypothetical protein [Borreliella tanukii]|uniref:hypothetical protein n=1 Tax=Borreliella tanukii TaxID=56146 RepID=UPI0026476CE7|nr:hypothetical protein [Borreliella tanukii]WKC80040.1 hypothetical protein QIA28_03925 [Borreliella tanukii]WKC80960.1 hypothetical protein QIA29_03910 [Borreliella tanukii]WKC81877.1 hypothetical protein QIA27_03910 [Borreliella tanukii]WKC82793.1 hypothetical protein QIA26_03905 [Borreliella tanukii]